MILGIDPGTKTTGYCLYKSIDSYKTGTIKAEKSMAVMIEQFIASSNADVIAIEDFIHRPYLKRSINTAANMGKLLGYLSAKFPNARFYDASKTKAGMKILKDTFKNSHEYSAYCVANYAAGQIRIKRWKEGN